MNKSKSIYVWDNVDNIFQKIESQIDLISHTTDLYDSQFCSEKGYCNLQRRLLGWSMGKYMETGKGY